LNVGQRSLEDDEKLRQLKVAIQAGIDSEDAGSVEEVVTRNRARRGKSRALKK
jgi:antitoxin ParD1/3/4